MSPKQQRSAPGEGALRECRPLVAADGHSITDQPVRMPSTSASTTVEAEQPVKPGAGQTPAGCFPAGQAGSDALGHHRPPVKQSAGQRRAGALRNPTTPTPKTTSDQQERAAFTQRTKPLGKGALPPRPRARCGWTLLLQSTKRPTDGKAVWQKCDARDCPDCGPAKQERNLAHDLVNLSKSGRPVVRRVVDDFDPATWKRLRAKIKRAAAVAGVEGGWVAYPTRDRMLVVFAVVGMVGELVTNLADELADAYAGLPAGEKIRRPHCWALNRKPAGKGDAEKSFRTLGASTVTHRTPEVLKRLRLYRDQVDEVAVPTDAWEAHNFTVPPLESLAYRALVEAFDLEEGKGKPSKRRGRAAA